VRERKEFSPVVKRTGVFVRLVLMRGVCMGERGQARERDSACVCLCVCV